MSDARLQGFSPVVRLMGHIKDSGNAWPRVTLDIDGMPLVLTVAGDRSKNPGAVNLTGKGAYPERQFYGKISTAGAFEPAQAARTLDRALKLALWDVLDRLRNGEAEDVFAESGKRLGRCCMCNRPLSDQESVEIGIGPICRKRAFG